VKEPPFREKNQCSHGFKGPKVNYDFVLIGGREKADINELIFFADKSMLH